MSVILDDQSNVSLSRSEVFDMFNIRGAVMTYTLKTCAGMVETAGRRGQGFTNQSVIGEISIPMSTLNAMKSLITGQRSRHQRLVIVSFMCADAFLTE